MWTRFMDMHSGGGSKEKWQYIFIEAPEEEAKVIFYNKFGHNPRKVTCTCCGEDYSIDSQESLEQLTGYDRGCKYIKKAGYIEEPAGNEWAKEYQSLAEYKKNKDVLIIPKSKIKPEWRKGEVPSQGYVWID